MTFFYQSQKGTFKQKIIQDTSLKLHVHSQTELYFGRNTPLVFPIL